MNDTRDIAMRDARYFESVNLWNAAAQEWIKAGRKKDAIACITIHNAVQKGNAFREAVKEEIGPEPELRPSTIKKWQQWHEDLHEIYSKHFKSDKNET